MKTLLSLFILFNSFQECFALDYYSQGSVDPNSITSWDLNPNGGSGAPVNFTNSGDRFIIQTGHTMITTGVWTIGGAGSVLEIQNGALLRGDHLLLLTGTFQIDNGGTYIHNNTGSVAEATGSSIFSAIESFAVNSNFEIRKWAGKNTGLPNSSPGIVWGNLIVNLQTDISADLFPWTWKLNDGSTLSIKGNLDIRGTYLNFPTEIRFTASGEQFINVDGNFLLSGGKTKVSIKSEPFQPLSGYTTMQVNGSILMADNSQLELGTNTTYLNAYGSYELRFKGNFLSTGYASLVLFSSSRQSYLVANGTSPQTFFSSNSIGSNFMIARGATVNLTSSFNLFGSDQTLAILGTLNQNGYSMVVNGKIETAGGFFNSSGNLTTGVACIACSNFNGSYDYAINSWCTVSGEKGRINFTGSTISVNNMESPGLLTAGDSSINSPGDIYFINSTATSLDLSFDVTYSVFANSVFSLDANSYVAGDVASYKGRGGTLRLGSPGGITATGNTTNGNIRTGLNKHCDFSGINSFEYFGTSPQVTGSGLPASIGGTLKINNTAGPGSPGVTLSQPTTVSGVLDLTLGKFTTSSLALLTIDSSGSVNLPVWGASYVAGPMRKIGSSSFRFPIGKGNNYAPLALTGTGAATDAYIAEYFMANPVTSIGSAFDNPPINQLSVAEWWTVDRYAGATAKNITLEATTYTNATLLSDLRVVRWDGSAWKNEGNSGYTGISAGQVMSNMVSDFPVGIAVPFTFGSTNSVVHPLPLNLVSFDAVKLTNTKALLNWDLAAYCSASAKFEIEKAVGNNIFSRIIIVNGSTTSKSYSSVDNDLKTGVNYYRLRMIDADGKVTYSRTVAVINNVNGLLITSLIPTVVNNAATLTVASTRQQKLDLVITDIQGRVMQKHSHTIAAGNTSIQLMTGRLAAGIYQVIGLTAENKTNVIQFIKQ